MAPHSGVLAWKIPWTKEPGNSLKVFLAWRRKWQPTPVFLPGESQGQGSLVGCRLWGHTESDTTKVTCSSSSSSRTSSTLFYLRFSCSFCFV